MGVKGTVEPDVRHGDFAPASVPVAQHICPSCGQHYTGRPDNHTCGEISQDAVEMARPAVVTPSGVAKLGQGFPGRQGIQDELDAIAIAVRMFHVQQPDQVLRACSAYHARLMELSIMLERLSGEDSTYIKLRTRQVDRYLEELEIQVKIHSRLIEVQRQDLSMSGFNH